MPLTVYVKDTCGTCRKAMDYLDERGVSYRVVDIITEPPTRAMLETNIDENNVKAYLNPRSAMYRDRKLSKNVPAKAEAIRLMLEDPNLIRRPVIIRGNPSSDPPGALNAAAVTFGFKSGELDDKIIP